LVLLSRSALRGLLLHRRGKAGSIRSNVQREKSSRNRSVFQLEIEAFFNYTMDDKLQVLSYLNLSEFRQSNIGITGDDQFNIGGSAKIMGSKMFTYFEGDHRKLDMQIRESISRVVFNQLMYGGDWKDVLKSNTLLSVPYWYQEGIIAYAAQGGTNESETYVKDLRPM